MSSSWSPPDPRRRPDPWATYAAPEEPRPPVRDDARAGLLAAVVTVLVGAPVGLLWAAVCPRVVVVVSGSSAGLAVPNDPAFIASEGYFLGATLLAGIVGGAVAWALARSYGPGVVVGLAVGGLAAAFVAMVVGEAVDAAEVRAALEAGRQGPLELNLRLRAPEALVGWPAAAVVTFAAITAATRRAR